MSEWRQCTLGDLVTLKRGHDLPKPQRISGNVPILGSFGITGWHNEAKSTGPGVTVGRSGASFGVVSFTDQDYWPLNTALYVIDFHGNDPKFAYYFLRSIDFSSFNSGSAQPSLNRNYIHPIAITVPEVLEQEAIAGVLGALDDKIELNRRMNQTLEAMARAIFKSWFVDFDPVCAKMEGRQPTHMDAATAALFPDALIPDTGLPEGWQRKRLGDVTDKITKGTTPTKAAINGATDESVIPFIKVKDVSDAGLIGKAELTMIPRSVHEGDLKRSILRGGDVLFSIAGTIGRVSIVPADLKDSNTNQAIALIRPLADNVGSEFIEGTLQLTHVQQTIRARIVQAVQANVSLATLSDLEITVPPNSIYLAWVAQTRSIYSKRTLLEEESATLAELRDTLLPKLMSGEVRVRDVEKEVEAVI